MPRIRSVKPDFWADEELARQTSRDARLFYIALWNWADEHSRLRGSTSFLKGQIFPYEEDITESDIEVLVGELIAVGKVVRYAIKGSTYLYLPRLSKHQRLDPRVDSKLPEPPGQSTEGETGKINTDLSAPYDADLFGVPTDLSVQGPPEGTEPHSPAHSGKVNTDKSARRPDKSALLYGISSYGTGVGGESAADRPQEPDLSVDKSADDHSAANYAFITLGCTSEEARAVVEHIRTTRKPDMVGPYIRKIPTVDLVDILANIRARAAPAVYASRSAPRCKVPGHEHELASNCRLCRGNALGRPTTGEWPFVTRQNPLLKPPRGRDHLTPAPPPLQPSEDAHKEAAS